MAAIRTVSNILVRQVFTSSLKSYFRPPPLLPWPTSNFRIPRTGGIRCATSDSNDKKVSSRLSQMQQLLHEAEERAFSAGNEPPPPKITLDHVSVSFARSGGPGGQNVNKVNTKVDMRFNVKNAYWLSDRIRDRIMQLEKNRINKDGEIVVSSTKTRTQKGNIEDALSKLQAIIDAASYVPPPPSEEQKKKIAKLLVLSSPIFPFHLDSNLCPVMLLLESIKGCRARKSFQKRSNSEEPETVGINPGVVSFCAMLHLYYQNVLCWLMAKLVQDYGLLSGQNERVYSFVKPL